MLDGQHDGISESMKGQCFGKEGTWFNDEWKTTARNQKVIHTNQVIEKLARLY